jgi:SAM-dependent methyltransferase
VRPQGSEKTRLSTRELYAESKDAVRGRFGADEKRASEHYRRYAAFVDTHAPRRPSRILDVGCGVGWSTWLMRKAGHDAEGLDLHGDALEAPDVPYTRGDVLALPFADGTFDAVALHTVLEHVGEPERALLELARVTRPGGRIIVVGPNLLSVPLNLYWALKHTGRVLRQGRIWEARTPDLPRHPGGNTMPESWAYTAHHAWHTLRKLAGERPVRFLRREPDPRPPFHADNDASYYCNPMDLVNWAATQPGLRAIQWWADDRKGARLYWPFGGGTWIVLEKLSPATGP